MSRNIQISKKNGPPITGKCYICEEITYLPYECKRCQGIFCDKHHLPENHSCVPIGKIIKEVNQYDEENLPKIEEEKIKNKIDELKRLKVLIQSMYENGEIGQIKYFDTNTSFDREIEELEAKLKRGTSMYNKEEIRSKIKELENRIRILKSESIPTEGRQKLIQQLEVEKKNLEDRYIKIIIEVLEEIGIEKGSPPSNETKQICQFGFHLVKHELKRCPICGLMLCTEHILVFDHKCPKYTPNIYKPPEPPSPPPVNKTFIKKAPSGQFRV